MRAGKAYSRVPPWFLMFRPVGQTIHWAQTNFLLLLFAILFWRYRRHRLSGLWLGFGTLVKPLFGILLLFPLLRRQWGVVLAAALLLLASVAATAAVFGLAPLSNYIFDGPGNRYPSELFTQPLNQSLSSWVLRLTKASLHGAVSLFHPLFLALAAIPVGITLWLLVRARWRTGDAELALLLTLGLLVYPAVLMHYAVLLLIPLLLVWKLRDSLPGAAALPISFITLLFTLLCIAPKYTFLSISLTWAALAALSYGSIGQDRKASAHPDAAGALAPSAE